MSRKVTVTEKLRKEIRKRITELTPDCKWYLIARSERVSMEQAYLRVDKEGKAQELTDDGVTSLIYEMSVGRQLLAERTVKWLEENELWVGAKFGLEEEVQDGR